MKVFEKAVYIQLSEYSFKKKKQKMLFMKDNSD